MDYPIAAPGEYLLEFSHTDKLPGIAGRFYYYRGPVRVLRERDFDDLMASIAAAQTALHEVATFNFCTADFDGNAVVEKRDLAYFASMFGGSDCRQSVSCAGDLNANLTIDGFDLTLFAWQVQDPRCY